MRCGRGVQGAESLPEYAKYGEAVAKEVPQVPSDCAGSYSPVPLPPQVQHLHAHYLCQTLQARHLRVHPCRITLQQPDDLQLLTALGAAYSFPASL